MTTLKVSEGKLQEISKTLNTIGIQTVIFTVPSTGKIGSSTVSAAANQAATTFVNAEVTLSGAISAGIDYVKQISSSTTTLDNKMSQNAKNK